MTTGTDSDALREAIAASWDRCAGQYHLSRNAASPIMRLQASEIAPRLEMIVERTGGRQGHIRQLAAVAGEVGHCLVVTDAEGVLVRLETGRAGPVTEWNGITLGSCWGERIAGTNGVSMALMTGQAVTVRGVDHFYTKLRQFACTGVPVLDAHGEVVGAINLVSLDKGNRADYLFGQHLLTTAAHRIQRGLFEKEFADALLVTVSRAGRGGMSSDEGLVAVDEAGVILGATATVGVLVGAKLPNGLKGQSFDAVFNVESETLARVPERVVSMPRTNSAALNLSVKLHDLTQHKRPRMRLPDQIRRAGRSPSSLRELAIGSPRMADRCRLAKTIFESAASMLLEGETGTGKTALIGALLEAHGAEAPVFRVDCATLQESEADRSDFQILLHQLRVLGTIPDAARGGTTLVLDNVNEMPVSAQAELRRFLEELEEGQRGVGPIAEVSHPRIVSTSKIPLLSAVRLGRFRDDLYFQLATAHIALPPLRDRERPEILAQALASQMAGRTIEFSPEAIDAIRSHAFPGNVRELRSALERALITLEGDKITLVDLRPTSIMAEHPPAPRTADGAPGCLPRRHYDERGMILDALTGSRWNVSEAARRMGMSRATINRKISQFGLERPS